MPSVTQLFTWARIRQLVWNLSDLINTVVNTRFFHSQVLTVQQPASLMQARGWWSGGLTSMLGPARRSFRYGVLHFSFCKIFPIPSTEELIVCMLFVSLLSEVPAEVHWPELQWRWERWSGPERAFIHAEAGRGAFSIYFIVVCWSEYYLLLLSQTLTRCS